MHPRSLLVFNLNALPFSSSQKKLRIFKIILRNRAEYRLILIKHIDNKGQVYSRKTGGDFYLLKKLDTFNIFPRADHA